MRWRDFIARIFRALLRAIGETLPQPRQERDRMPADIEIDSNIAVKFEIENGVAVSAKVTLPDGSEVTKPVPADGEFTMRLSLGLGLQHHVMPGGGGGGGGRPAWLPAWADSGVSYVEGEAYFDDTLITDLATIHGAGFDPTKVTGAGMAVTTLNGNLPTAAGAFVNRMADFDFTILIHFDTTADSPVGSVGVVMLATDPDTDEGPVIEWGGGVGNLSVTDLATGSFNTVGTIEINHEYKVCGSNTVSGWLSSLNGGTAVLDSPQSVGTPNAPSLGFEQPASPHNQMEGTIRAIFFGPVTDVAAEIEARATL